jgi:hypothetical protein
VAGPRRRSSGEIGVSGKVDRRRFRQRTHVRRILPEDWRFFRPRKANAGRLRAILTDIRNLLYPEASHINKRQEAAQIETGNGRTSLPTKERQRGSWKARITAYWSVCAEAARRFHAQRCSHPIGVRTIAVSDAPYRIGSYQLAEHEGSTDDYQP